MPKKPKSAYSAYQLKVSLIDIEPPIWRRFLVTGDQILYQLHLILQTIMGWETYHRYDFTFDDVKYGEPDPDYQPDIEYARKHQLKEVLHTKGQTFIYTYDYGDNWCII